MSLLEPLSHAILPIFAAPALGWLLARAGLIEAGAAPAVNRIGLLATLPALLFGMTATAPIDAVAPRLLALYVAIEAALWALTAALARLVFRRGRREALMLGMATAFVNHVFFVLPIAEALYGPAARAPIAAIITIDTVVLFASANVLLDVLSAADGAARALGRVARNPATLSVLAGLAVNLAGTGLHPGLVTFSDFMGAAAAPMMLFAMGAALSGAGLWRRDGAALAVVGLKTVAHPLLLAAAFAAASAPADEFSRLALFVAAGPCGAMPFALALRYGLPTESIARAIILSTLVSLGTLAALA